MELMMKLYSDKPSKIGVKYVYEYQAVKAYEAIFTNKPGPVFSLQMELVKNKVNLLLVSEQTGERIAYQGLDYKMEQLKRLQAFIQPGAELQFVHVFSKANSLMIAKPFRTQNFISLTHYEIIGPGNFAGSF